MAIGGASAGGHLAAVVAHMCRDEGIPLVLQLLGVPVCDLHVFTPAGELKADCPYESQREMRHTQPLCVERMSYFHRHFLGNPRPAELENVSRLDLVSLVHSLSSVRFPETFFLSSFCPFLLSFLLLRAATMRHERISY